MSDSSGSAGTSGGQPLTGVEKYKREAALGALQLVRSGMLVGLGTGSTAYWLVAGLGEKLSRGQLTDVTAVATSEATAQQARRLGIQLTELPPSGLDLAIDGMDELAPGLDVIKGLGGALTREKIVAAAADRFVLIGDDSKLVGHLGQRAPLPVEVVRFGHPRTAVLLEELGLTPMLRLQQDAPFVTDNGNFIYDCRLPTSFDARQLAAALGQLPGVVEHGLFLGMAELAFVASEQGVQRLTREWSG